MAVPTPSGLGLPHRVRSTESNRSVLAIARVIQPGEGVSTGANDTPPPASFAIRTMLTLRTASPFDLIDRIEQQLSQQLQNAERVPAAEVHETSDAFEVVLELPGVDKAAIDVKATDRTLVISAERRSSRELPAQPAGEGQPAQAPLLSEFRYGTWSRSFRFPVAIERDQLKASYRDGLLTVTAPKANTVSSVTVQVEG